MCSVKWETYEDTTLQRSLELTIRIIEHWFQITLAHEQEFDRKEIRELLKLGSIYTGTDNEIYGTNVNHIMTNK